MRNSIPPGTGAQSQSNSSDLLFITLSNEIEEALKKLNLINGKMNECLTNETNLNSSATVHTLQVLFLKKVSFQESLLESNRYPLFY